MARAKARGMKTQAAQIRADVSVVIAAFDAADCIERALDSAVRQTLPPREILVVDDGSTDATADLVRGFSAAWPCVNLISLPVNVGPSAARNVAMQAARGKWVAILDADDAWRPDRLESLTAWAERLDADLMADNLIFYDQHAAVPGRKAFSASSPVRQIGIQDLFESDLQDHSLFSYGLLKPLFRKAFIERTGLFYDESIRCGEDFHYYAELMFHGARCFVTRDAYYIYTTPVGEFSRQVSTARTTIARFDEILRNADVLAARYAGAVDVRLAAAMGRRRRMLEAVRGADIAREYRSSGNFGRYVATVLSQPATFGLLFYRFRRRIRRALDRRLARRRT